MMPNVQGSGAGPSPSRMNAAFVAAPGSLQSKLGARDLRRATAATSLHFKLELRLGAPAREFQTTIWYAGACRDPEDRDYPS